MTTKVAAYQKADIIGKTQLDLVVQVYDGAIAAYRAAGEAYSKSDNNSGYEHMERAKRFVTHLYTTLDMDKGGEIADQLSKLYAFVISQTNLAQATKDLTQIDDNISILNNLRSGWMGLKEQAVQQGKMERAQSPVDVAEFTTSA